MNQSDRRYLELLKLALLDLLNPVSERAISQGDGTVKIESVSNDERHDRWDGEDWPVNAVTMIGYARLSNLQNCIEATHREGIPGDIIETGVWRGGAVIFAAAVLDVLGDPRKVYAADSFQGLPEGDGEKYPADEGDLHHTVDFLAASQDEVRANFARFGVSTDRVRFWAGWFRDTLPLLSGSSWSVLRLDGDMYESSILGFQCLYPHLSQGGFCIVDDYGVPNCRTATDDYREAHDIAAGTQTIGASESIFWRKEDKGVYVPAPFG